jgi:hypothetical protein
MLQEVTTPYYENHTKYINTLCEQDSLSCLMLEQVVRIVTIVAISQGYTCEERNARTKQLHAVISFVEESAMQNSGRWERALSRDATVRTDRQASRAPPRPCSKLTH